MLVGAAIAFQPHDLHPAGGAGQNPAPNILGESDRLQVAVNASDGLGH
jgi:hypothetical protein